MCYWIQIASSNVMVLAKPRHGNRSGRPALVRLPVGSRFLDWTVKPVETPVKFSFLATKRHLSSNWSTHIYFITNKTFYKKKSINKPHLSKHLLNVFMLWFNMLWPLCYAPSPFGHATNQTSAKYTLKLPNQITIKHACGRGLRYVTF